jgi:hypothetical protein
MEITTAAREIENCIELFENNETSLSNDNNDISCPMIDQEH